MSIMPSALATEVYK